MAEYRKQGKQEGQRKSKKVLEEGEIRGKVKLIKFLTIYIINRTNN
jgi:hypothetical protein